MNSGLNLKLSAENTPPARSQCGALLVGRDGRQREVRRAGVIADVVDAADVFRRERGGAPDLAEPGLETAAQHIIGLAGFELPGLEALPQLLRDEQPFLQVEKRIRTQVELTRVRVEAGDDLLVRRKREQRIRRALGGDFCQLFVFGLLRQRAVGIFDCPVIVGTDRRFDVGALRLALHGNVQRVVIHD
jgi:hypothetical protein